MNKNIIQLRLSGKHIEPGLVKSRELADILTSVEEMIASILVREDLSIKKEDVVVGLTEISGGSIKLKFSSIKQAAAVSALMIAASAVTGGNFENLPRSSVTSLQTIASFARKHNCLAELMTLEPECTVAKITSETEIYFRPTIIGETTIYGRILRVGGKTPRAMIETLEGELIYCDLDVELAKQLGQKLYKLVSLSGVAKWDAHDLILEDFYIKKMGEYEGRSISSAVDELSTVIGQYFKDIIDVPAYISEIRGGDSKE